MSNEQHAIVIGLNRYKLPGYDLTAPVRDAIRFARWVTQPGRVKRHKDHLRLLLSPHEDDDLEEFAELMEQATSRNMRQVLTHYSKEGIEKPKRLWIFYAGHALAPLGANADQAPQLMPPDVEDIATFQMLPELPFDSVRSALLMTGPDEQVIFIDACRAPLPNDTGSHGHTSLYFDNRSDLPEPKTQALLYGTTHGRVANQVGTGLFSEALLKGLQGRAQLEEVEFEDRFNLRFPELVSYVTGEVDRLSENANIIPQVPDPLRQPNLILAEFETRPKAIITLHVRPAKALPNAQVRIQTQVEGIRSTGPPVQPPLRWEVSLGRVAYEVVADGFKRFVKRFEFYETNTENVTLFPSTLESLPVTPSPLREIPDTQANLSLVAHDRLVSYAVFDDQGTLIATGKGSADHQLRTGFYRIQWSLPGSGVVSNKTIELTPEGHREEYAPESRYNSLPSPLVDKLNMAGMNVTGAGMFPSEVFNFSTVTHFGSLLWWAADAARYPGGHGDKLRRLGVETVNIASGSSWVQVLVGDSEAEQDSMLAGLEVRFGRGGVEEIVETRELPGLVGFARQTQAEVPEEGASLVLISPGINDVALPVPHIPGRISVVIMARESNGQVGIHRYLLEGEPQRPFSDMIRVREQQWRALERRTQISDDEAKALLEDEFIDPLTRIVIGYRLWHAGRLDLWFDRVNTVELQQIPDLTILIALRSSSDARAIARALNLLGSRLPLLGIGFQMLHHWLQQNARRNALPPPLPLRSPVPGAVWTTFDAREAETPVATSDAIPATVLAKISAPWVDRIAHVVEATARVDYSAPRQPEIKGTAFRIAPSVLLTMSYLFDTDNNGTADDKLESWFAKFTEENQSGLIQIMGRSTGGSRLLGKLQTVCLVQTDDDEEPAGLVKLSFDPPQVGQRIAVVGFPKASGTTSEPIAEAFAGAPMGQKYVLPGQITRIGDDFIEYAAFTLGGTSGGPVVNVDTGEVIGVHFAGRFDNARGIKFGFALPLSRIKESFWHLIP